MINFEIVKAELDEKNIDIYEISKGVYIVKDQKRFGNGADTLSLPQVVARYELGAK